MSEAVMFDAALDYARRGWRVFPLHTIQDGRCTCAKGKDCGKDSGKHPRTEHGFKDATTDETTIRQWWTRWPNANIGIATGNASGFIVVDVDPRKGGDDTLADLERNHGRLPDTVESETGGKGRHIIFQYPGLTVPSKADALGPGLDIKADAGYIVAPPSFHLSGQCYEWEAASDPDEVPIAEAPTWLLTMLKAESNGNGHARRTETEWLTLLQGVPDGQRYDVATQIAGHFLGIGRPVEEVEALILGYLSQCTPPADTKGQDKCRRMVRDLAAKDAKKQTAQQTDPLVLLRDLPETPDMAAVEQALRALAAALAGTDPLKRTVVRQEAVATLKAKNVDGAAKLVDAALATAGNGAPDDESSQPVVLGDPEPWPDAVDGAALLAAIEKTLTRFVILPRDAAVAIALWVLHVHALKAFSLSPILAVLSPTMRCGKSTLLNLLAALLPRALSTSNITPAALFRSMEKYKPCLLVDEGDTFLTLSEELRGILNSGHTRSGAAVVRCVGDDAEPRLFSTWAAKVLAAIGKLPPTVMDRSIVIAMQRKAPGERVERFRHTKLEELTPLCRQAARWATDNLAALRDADPDTPEQLNDRAADNWRPLLAIADLIGGEWPQRARDAALTLAGEPVEESHFGLILIGDIMAVFAAQDTDKLSTGDIITELLKIEEGPWSGLNRGKPITSMGVAKLLRPFKIKSKTLRIGNATAKGYEREQFNDASIRYFEDSKPSHPSQINEIGNIRLKSTRNIDPSVTGTKEDVTIEKQRIGTGVTTSDPENEALDVCDPDFDMREPVAWEEL